MSTAADARTRMVEEQVVGRGVRDARVIEAMRAVPREVFLPEELQAQAYEDGPLPIGGGQTISQPFVVAHMAEALAVESDDRVLEVGAGSGYAAAVLGRLAAEIDAVERQPELVASARRHLAEIGATNVRIHEADGSRGWPAAAPYDAILVSAGGPYVPQALVDQLRPDGRLVMPVGPSLDEQELVLVERTPRGVERHPLGGVRFVPLVGASAWPDRRVARPVGWPPVGVAEEPAPDATAPASPPAVAGGRPRGAGPGTPRSAISGVPATVERIVAEAAEPFSTVEHADLGPLLERIGDARVVLLGEASHGTSEFYRLRARVTLELARRGAIRFVALEADWPDAARLDRWVRSSRPPERTVAAVRALPDVDVAQHRRPRVPRRGCARSTAARPRRPCRGFHGLDLYTPRRDRSVPCSRISTRWTRRRRAVARERYGCLTPYQDDPADVRPRDADRRLPAVRARVVDQLRELLERRLEYAQEEDPEAFFDAEQQRAAGGRRGALLPGDVLRRRRLLEPARRRTCSRRSTRSSPTAGGRHVAWSGRTTATSGTRRRPRSRTRGELNLGQLGAERFGDSAYHGRLRDRPRDGRRGARLGRRDAGDGRRAGAGRAATRPWRGTAASSSFLLALRSPAIDGLRAALSRPRLERAIGVVYRPETERLSHYFEADLASQFDEYVWVAETHAVTPLGPTHGPSIPAGHPFAELDR